jgi:Mg/Co/Ni transporter MgtE
MKTGNFSSSIAPELRQKLKLMPAQEVAYILESLEANERLVVWEEVKEGADPILACFPTTSSRS